MGMYFPVFHAVVYSKLSVFKKPPIGYAYQKSCLKFSISIDNKTKIILAA